MRKEIIVCIYFIIVQMSFTMGAVPGTFFWKPRLGLDLTLPSRREQIRPETLPTIENIREGRVVIVEGYQTGMTILALSAAYTAGTEFHHLNPLSAPYYTNSYRWALRHFSLLPPWISGTGGNYCETQKLWKKRFTYMDSFMPEWLKKIFFFVQKEEWDKEEAEMKLFQSITEPGFGKYYRYPNQVFDNWAWWYKEDSAERFRSSGIDLGFKP